MFWDLIREMKDRLETDLKEIGLRAPTPQAAFVVPSVIIGAAVPKAPAKDNTPGVMIAPITWSREGDLEKGTVSLVLQTYGYEKTDQAPGLAELNNLAAAIRRSLIRPPMPIGNRFELTGEMKLFNDLTVAHPFYRAELVTEWQWPAVIEHLGVGDQHRIYGAGYPADF